MDNRKRHNIKMDEFLPHREPMLMVDELIEIKSQEVISSFKIFEDNIFVEEGKFNEAGLVENIAQTCSTITGQEMTEDAASGVKIIGFITNIKKVHIYELPKVNETIISKANLNSLFGDICNISCQTFCGERLLVDAEISLFLKKVPDHN